MATGVPIASSRKPLGLIVNAGANTQSSRHGHKRKDGSSKSSRTSKRHPSSRNNSFVSEDISHRGAEFSVDPQCNLEESVSIESMNITGSIELANHSPTHDDPAPTSLLEFSSTDINMPAEESVMHIDTDSPSKSRLPPGCIDIDCDKDPQMASDLMETVVAHYRDRERVHRVSNLNYVETLQTDVNEQMRAILIDWLVEVAEEYNLRSDTLYLTVNLVDRYLAKEKVERGILQLVGITAMLIASKYQEIYPPSINKFVYISDNTYTAEQVIRMEERMLNVLEFNLTVVTAKCFLRRFVKAACVSLPADQTLLENFHYLSSYITELTLQEYSFVKYLPSTIAASAVVLALMTLELTPWTETLAYYTQYSPEDAVFHACLQDLFKVFSCAAENHLQAIREKYSSDRFACVAARLSPPLMKSHH